MTRRYCLFVVLLFQAQVLWPQPLAAERTEYGHPDLQGIWNFWTSAPYERPESFGEREFLTEEEIAVQDARAAASAIAAEQREANVAETLLTDSNATSAGSVNNFWMERSPVESAQRTSVIVHPRNGRLPPVQPGVTIQRSDANGVREIPGERPVRFTHGGIDRSGPEDRGLSERCLVFNNGPPLFSGPYNNNLQIIQNRDHVVILTEMGFDARIVPLGNLPHAPNEVTSWSGDSRGHFEGDTLVVETRNFTSQIASLGFREAAYGSGENRILIERFTPKNKDFMEYEFTVQDLTTFTDHITGVLPLHRMPGIIYEYACHAGNYALRNILRGARQQEQQ